MPSTTTIGDQAGGRARSSSACRSAATSRWRSPRASRRVSAGSSCRAPPPNRSGSGCCRTWPRPPPWTASTPDVLTRLNARYFRRLYPAAIAEPIVAGGFWTHGGAEALRAIVGERFLPRLASLPGPDADHQRVARPPVPALRPDVRAGGPRRAPGPAGRGGPQRQPRPACGLHRGRPPVRAVARRDADPAPDRGASRTRGYTDRTAKPDVLRFDARSQGCLPRRRLGHPFPPGHQGPAQGDAAPRRQADHPVRGRGSRRGRDRAGHHRHVQPEAGDRGPLRPLLRARAPARGEGRHRDAPAGPGDQRPGPGGVRPPEGAARPRPRRPDGQGSHRPRAVRGDPARRRRRRRTGRASAS